jgi:hypothetical protein
MIITCSVSSHGRQREAYRLCTIRYNKVIDNLFLLGLNFTYIIITIKARKIMLMTNRKDNEYEY